MIKYIRPHHFLFLFVFFLLVSLSAKAKAATSDNLLIHFIDVGYGDAIMIQSPDGHVCMIDAGDNERLARFIESQKIKKIDWGLITHGHKNHFEGFKDLTKAQLVKQLYINPKEEGDKGYVTFLKQTKERIPMEALSYSQVLNCGEEVLIRVIHPLEDVASLSLNDASVASLLKYKDITILLTADIGPAIQERILNYEPSMMEADIIQIPHHGDHLIKDLYEKSKGKIFIASTGPNPWGLPNEALFNEMKGALYRTDHQGTITVITDGQKIKIQTQR